MRISRRLARSEFNTASPILFGKWAEVTTYYTYSEHTPTTSTSISFSMSAPFPGKISFFMVITSWIEGK